MLGVSRGPFKPITCSRESLLSSHLRASRWLLDSSTMRNARKKQCANMLTNPVTILIVPLVRTWPFEYFYMRLN